MTDSNWAFALSYNALTLAFCAFGYSWAGFKPELKAVTGWDEVACASIFAASNFGQNFVVHMGMIYDRYGIKVATTVAIICKFVGLMGMFFMTIFNSFNVWAFAFCLWIDAQSSGLTIIFVQMQAQKVTLDPKRRGTAASICTAAFGFGAVLWTTMYDIVFKPNMELHFFYGCVASVATLLLGYVLQPMFVYRAMLIKEEQNEKKDASLKAEVKKDDKKEIVSRKKGKNVDKEEKKESEEIQKTVRRASEVEDQTLLQITFSRSFFSCMLTTCVTWGTAVLWISNLASMATAAGFSPAEAAFGRFLFNVSGFTGRICSGPLTDFFRGKLPLEFFSFLTALSAVASSIMMRASGGNLLYIAAILEGLGFGILSTIVPLLCRQMAPHKSGTVYAMSKVGSMLVSNYWMFKAGQWADEARGDAPVCIGPDCYGKLWSLVETSCILIIAVLIVDCHVAYKELHAKKIQ